MIDDMDKVINVYLAAKPIWLNALKFVCLDGYYKAPELADEGTIWLILQAVAVTHVDDRDCPTVKFLVSCCIVSPAHQRLYEKYMTYSCCYSGSPRIITPRMRKGKLHIAQH